MNKLCLNSKIYVPHSDRAVSLNPTVPGYSFNLLPTSRAGDLNTIRLHCSPANQHSAGDGGRTAIRSFIPGHVILNEVPFTIPTLCHCVLTSMFRLASFSAATKRTAGDGRRDATCPISAEAALTGGGKEEFKLVGN